MKRANGIGGVVTAGLMMVGSVALWAQDLKNPDAEKPKKTELQEQDWSKAEAALKEQILKDKIEIEHVKTDFLKEHRFYRVSHKMTTKFGEKEMSYKQPLGLFVVKSNGEAKEIKMLYGQPGEQQAEEVTEIVKAEKIQLSKEENVKELADFCEKVLLGQMGWGMAQQNLERKIEDIKKEGNSYAAKVTTKMGIIKYISEYEFKLNEQNEIQGISRQQKFEYEGQIRGQIRQGGEEEDNNKKKDDPKGKSDDQKKEKEDDED